MYQDRDSIKVFQRIHERGRLVERARHIGEKGADADLFLGHARAQARGNLLSNGLIIAVSVIVVVAAVWYWN